MAVSFLIPGFDNESDARAFLKDVVRFLPASGIEVWLVAPPGLFISGESVTNYDMEAIRRDRPWVIPLPEERSDVGFTKSELLYGGLF